MGTSASILVAEDDLAFRDTLEDVLLEEGYSVSVARNGAEALGMLPHLGRPALILLDLQMPVMDGVTFLNHLRHWPDRDQFEVVIMSAGVSPEWLAKVPGVVRAMKKPFDIAEIVTLAEEFVARHPARTASATTGGEQPASFLGRTTAPPSAPEE